MISGNVNSRREAVVRVAVIGAAGQRHSIDAVIDTGFTGYLTMPYAIIRSLGLPWLCRQAGLLADGQIQHFDVYVAKVDWDGVVRTVEVEAIDTDSLIGMRMLDGFALHIDVVIGGAITITPLLPAP